MGSVIGLWKITILRHRVAGRGAVAIQSSLFASKQTGKIGRERGFEFETFERSTIHCGAGTKQAGEMALIRGNTV